MGLFEKNQGTTNMLVLAITKERKGELVIGGKSEADLKYASILHRTPIGSQSQTHRGLCNMMNIGPRAPPPSPPVHCERKGMGLGWEGRREVALLSRSVVISLLKEEVTTSLAKRQLEKSLQIQAILLALFYWLFKGRELQVKLHLRSPLLLCDMQIIKLN